MILIGAGLLIVLFQYFITPSGPAPSLQARDAATLQSPALNSDRIISSADLPPAGTHSLFDHHIQQLGEIPYPFAALLDSLKSLDRWGQGSVGLLIPDGRSLAKAHADDRQPRVLAAAQLTPLQKPGEIPSIYSGRLFLGFVESLDTIEIIAYNEVAGRFEYQLLTNYCDGCKPELLYAKRAICTACHQSGSPIFSVRPWSETNSNPDVAKRIADAQNIAWHDASEARYHGVAVSTQILASETFDELVLKASRIRLAQQSWLDGCGSVPCRRYLLAQALQLLLEPGSFDPTAAKTKTLQTLQAENWPSAGLRVADDRLPDRIPEPASRLRASLRAVARWWRDILGSDTAAPSSRDRLAALNDLPRVASHLDPLQLRPELERLESDNLQGLHAVAQMFIPQDRENLRRWSNQSVDRIYALILAGHLDDELQPAPFNRTRILKALAEALEQTPLKSYLDTAKLIPKAHAEDSLALPIEAGSPLEAFARYCFDCHRGNPVEHLNFMAGMSAAEVLTRIRQQPRIHEVLDYSRVNEQPMRLMPPPSSEQRRLLEDAIRNGADDLETMQKALP